MSAEQLLSRLDRVRSTGSGRWIACCPAHEDRSPSLSIRELADGRILLHDFGGCGTDDVLSAIGLTMADLFPDRLPTPDRGFRRSPKIPASDILAALAYESYLISIIAMQVADKREVSDADFTRLALAARRIGSAASGQD